MSPQSCNKNVKKLEKYRFLYFLSIKQYRLSVFRIDVNARDGKNNPFRNICGVIADPFEILAHEHEIERALGKLFVVADSIETHVFGSVE